MKELYYKLRIWTALKAVNILIAITPGEREGLIILNHIMGLLLELARVPRNVSK